MTILYTLLLMSTPVNRTLMELKSHRQMTCPTMGSAVNRTLMELKCNKTAPAYTDVGC